MKRIKESSLKKRSRFSLRWNIFKPRKPKSVKLQSNLRAMHLAQDRTTTHAALPTRTYYDYDDDDSPSRRHSRNKSVSKTMPLEIRFRTEPPDSPMSFISHLTGDPALKDPPIGGGGSSSSSASRTKSKTKSFAIFSGGLLSLASQSQDDDDDEHDLNLSRQLFVHPVQQSICNYKSSFPATSKVMHKLVHDIFDEVDVQRSGYLDRNELYTCILLLQLKLASSFGTLALSCRRHISRAQVYQVFDIIDSDKSGRLNSLECATAMFYFVEQMQVWLTWVVLGMAVLITYILFSFGRTIFLAMKDAYISKDHVHHWISSFKDSVVPLDDTMNLSNRRWMAILLFRMYEYCVDDQDHGLLGTPWLWYVLGMLVGCTCVPWMRSQCDDLIHCIPRRQQDTRKKIISIFSF